MENWLDRTKNLIGKKALERLQKSNILIIGLGGVGSFCAEAIARAGINNITLIDNDTVSITNLNRQLIADTTTINSLKTDIMRERILKINPTAKITTHSIFINEENIPEYITTNYDYVIDCIDSVPSKIAIIKYCKEINIPIISSMGTGNKLHPSKLEINDISKTSVCPLARTIRKKLTELNIRNLKVVFSTELPIVENNKSTTPSSISFVPSVAGLLLTSEVVNDLIKNV